MKLFGYTIGYTLGIACIFAAQGLFIWAVFHYLIGFSLTPLQVLGAVLLANFLSSLKSS